MHVRVWTYRVAPGREAEFARAYAADGAWVALFRQAPGFLGTELLRPAEVGGWWMTLDRWASAAAFAAFQAAHGAAYAALDATCDALTEEERLVGAFQA